MSRSTSGAPCLRLRPPGRCPVAELQTAAISHEISMIQQEAADPRGVGAVRRAVQQRGWCHNVTLVSLFLRTPKEALFSQLSLFFVSTSLQTFPVSVPKAGPLEAAGEPQGSCKLPAFSPAGWWLWGEEGLANYLSAKARQV